MLGDPVFQGQPPAGNLELVQVAQRLARIGRHQRREQRGDIDLALRRRLLVIGGQAAQTNATVLAPGQDQPRRACLETGRREHAPRQERVETERDLDLGQLDQELAVRPLGAHVDAHQLDGMAQAQTQLRVTDLDPDLLVRRSDGARHVWGQPGQLDRATRQANPKRRGRDDHHRQKHGEQPEQQVRDPQGQVRLDRVRGGFDRVAQIG